MTDLDDFKYKKHMKIQDKLTLSPIEKYVRYGINFNLH